MGETRLKPKLGESTFDAFFFNYVFVFNLSITFAVTDLAYFALRAKYVTC